MHQVANVARHADLGSGSLSRDRFREYKQSVLRRKVKQGTAVTTDPVCDQMLEFLVPTDSSCLAAPLGHVASETGV